MGKTTLTVGFAGAARTALVRAIRDALRDKYEVATIDGDSDAQAAVGRLLQRSPGVELVLVEPSGDDSSATRWDLSVYVVDSAAAGHLWDLAAGFAQHDLLVIDEAAGASIDAIAREARQLRGGRPFVFTNLAAGEGLEQVIDFIETDGLLDEATPDG